MTDIVRLVMNYRILAHAGISTRLPARSSQAREALHRIFAFSRWSTLFLPVAVFRGLELSGARTMSWPYSSIDRQIPLAMCFHYLIYDTWL